MEEIKTNEMYLVPKTHKILRAKTKGFDFEKNSAKELAESLAEIMIQNKGVGLAAPQCGIDASVFVFGNPNDRESIVAMFNPKIVDRSAEQDYLTEGCLSFPDLYVKIRRPSVIRVRYQTVDGETVTEKYQGLSARIIQHEYDHLQGITFNRVANKVHLDRAIKDRKIRLRRR